MEDGSDFRFILGAIFARFASDYPSLAEALTARFGSTDACTGFSARGRVSFPRRPPLCTGLFRMHQYGDRAGGRRDGREVAHLPPGRPRRRTLAKGQKRDSVGRVGISAKVSTAKPNPESRDERKVVYVYTKDWADEADVMPVRERLREMGVIERIGYKRNIETFRGEYSEKGKKVTYYSA